MAPAVSADDPATRHRQLEVEYTTTPQKGHALSIEALLDTVICVFDECSSPSLRRERCIAEFVESVKSVVNRAKFLRLRKSDFEVIRVIGRGAFGEVAVVRMIQSGEVFAMKILNKADMLQRAETACFKEERDVLVHGDRRWITSLHFAFQDEKNLYLVMDYYVGGDMLTLLSKFDVHMPEDIVRFYVAEMVLAIDSVHKLGYVHRDIKPDNVLLDAAGHIRLADFGSCLRVMEDGCVSSNVAVGTPDYISPEILCAMDDNRGHYGQECDWWSLGICMYEMLYGSTPFYSESLVETYGKIMNHNDMLEFPDDMEFVVSEPAKDLMMKLICAREARFGRNGLNDFKEHPFFNGINWDELRTATPPYRPEVSSPTDTSNFDPEFGDDYTPAANAPALSTNFTGKHLPFIGFTYTHGSMLSDARSIADSLGGSAANGENSASLDSYERRMATMETEKAELLRKFNEASSLLSSRFPDGGGGGDGGANEREKEYEQMIAQLKEEIQILKMRAEESSSAAAAAAVKPKDLEELEKTLKEMKEKNRQLILEKTELQRENEDVSDQLNMKEKEVKEAIKHRESAKLDYEELNTELLEERSKQRKAEKEAAEKEKERAQLQCKIDQLREEKRTIENARMAEIEKLAAELESEKRQREGMQAQQMAAVEQSSEAARLVEEIDRLNEKHSEIVAQEEKKRKQLVEHYQSQLAELQAQFDEKEGETGDLRQKYEEEREARCSEQEQLAMFERSVKTFEETKEQLTSENEMLREEMNRLQRDLNSKEPQIRQILNWVNEGKETKQIIQQLTNKLTNEVESLQAASNDKKSNVVQAAASSWMQTRISRKEQVASREAQNHLAAEVRMKAKLEADLSNTKAALEECKARLEGREREIMALNRDNKNLRDQLMGGIGSRGVDVLEVDTGAFFNYDHRPGQRDSIAASSSDYEVSNSSLLRAQLRNSPAISNSSLFSAQIYENMSRVPTSTPTPSTASTMVAGTSAGRGSPKVLSSSLNSAFNGSAANGHSFSHVRLNAPTKCHHCTSILVGLDRQGLSCSKCQYACHVHCLQRISPQCPVPVEARRPIGIDPDKGVGTAYEGLVKTPKPDGVKKGWRPTFVVVCDFKLYLYDCDVDKNGKAINIQPVIRQVLDMRDSNFSVSHVTDDDVIHANKTDLGKIFRVTTSQIESTTGATTSQQQQLPQQSFHPSPYGTTGSSSSATRQYTLLMAESPEERNKWIMALNELKSLVKKTIQKKGRHLNKAAFVVKEVFDKSAISQINIATCAAVIDRTKMVMGFVEGGLYTVELDRETLAAVGGEKENKGRTVERVEYVEHEQLLVALVGPAKERTIRLIPTAALDGRELKWIKVTESKGCHAFAVGTGPTGTTCLAVAVRKSVSIFEIVRDQKTRHRKVVDLAMPAFPQCLAWSAGALAVGYPHGFRMWLMDTKNNQISLVNPEDQSLSFLGQHAYEAEMLIEIANEGDLEYLLVFSKLAVYVDRSGRRSRSDEIMFPATARKEHGFAYAAPHLSVYSEYQIDIFNVRSAEWVQTVNLRLALPLSSNGLLSLCMVNGCPYVVLSSDVLTDEDIVMIPSMHSLQRGGKKQPKRGFVVRAHTKEEQRAGDRRSILPISGPSDFQHLHHMGPGNATDLMRNMIDLSAPASSSANTSSSKLMPVMRSGSSVNSVRKDDPNTSRGVRPISSQSRSSDSSSLDRDGKMSTSSDNSHYLEPNSRLNRTHDGN
ncbi:hypothetical protein PFISCL1PPCAC_3627 [Pristionchus fissidentatus]|uniref:non-specific serine/threonine protein kinase n=1 Tax=Pristionchus fissidentatus TaxID=1538716 RepID=A0AAV5V3D0_9BILA|nr:hypothetical protein PFISCL1PPCAC_3627 [Pristionchus fissidentatus]